LTEFDYMKKLWMQMAVFITISELSSGSLEVWTTSEGKPLGMDLLSVVSVNKGLVAQFRTKNGANEWFDASWFSKADQERLRQWSEPVRTVEPVFERVETSKENPFIERGFGYAFFSKNRNVFGVKKKTLKIVNSDLSKNRFVWDSYPQGAGPYSGGSWKSATTSAWSLEHPHIQTLGTPRGLVSEGFRFGVILEKVGNYELEKVKKSSFEGEMVLAVGHGIAKTQLVFPSRAFGKSNARKIGDFEVWLEVDPPKSKNGEIKLYCEDVYWPSRIQSVTFKSGNREIYTFREITNSGVEARITYWDGIRENTVKLEKKP
jgi:hypothetical protein